MRNIWQKYKDTIRRNCSLSNVESGDSVNYWRNTLFSTTMIFVLPLCFIALVPSLFLITFENKEYITLLHFVTIGLMLFIAFAPSVKVKVRKLIFSLTVYAFAAMLNFFTSPSSGSVLIYFYAACVFSIIIFDNKYAYWWSHLVLLISVMFGLIIHFEFWDFEYNVDMSSVNEWVAVSSNVIFVCYLSSALIPKIFIGLENHINEQNRLRNELEKSQDALQLKNAELEEYVFVASHDLQEPLRLVSSFMDKLNTKYQGQLDEKALQYIHFASEGATRMKQIILDLLDYSRAGRTTESLEKVDVNQLVSDFIDLRAKVISEKSVTIAADELPVLHVRKDGFTQVLHLLLDNAIKYSKEGTAPQLEIDATEKIEGWRFSIKDNGIGIDPKFFDKIFLIFQQLHNRNEYGGTGVGLSLAKKHVESWGGKIWVESKKGRGAIFYFTVPK
ncbi:sensor histidine kinase [Marivirga harenae]|uniref:sensor histidine kinase n=1 Tax=Marivirga harenae TaxID=2010992 RepID=UPI0026DED8DB|nr:ATP-binding protein [Marivirga harenae]WKV12423.1 ATP-binding protein [Marivirga harenae]